MSGRRGWHGPASALRSQRMARAKQSHGQSEAEHQATETYTEPNFLRVYTADNESSGQRLATIEHLSYTAAGAGNRSGWSCTTVVDGEAMSKEDALFIARSYAAEHNIPVIYESHAD
jgi:hypothetical protein